MATKTIIIHPGEQITLPLGTKIDALIINGSISVTSTCSDLPTPEAQKCYQMDWSVSESSNFTLDQGEGAIQYIKIGGVQYNINLTSIDPGLSFAFENISNQIPGVFDYVSVAYVDLANRKDFTLLFRSIPTIATGIEIWMTGDGFPVNGLFIRPYESDNCGDVEA